MLTGDKAQVAKGSGLAVGWTRFMQATARG